MKLQTPLYLQMDSMIILPIFILFRGRLSKIFSQKKEECVLVIVFFTDMIIYSEVWVLLWRISHKSCQSCESPPPVDPCSFTSEGPWIIRIETSDLLKKQIVETVNTQNHFLGAIRFVLVDLCGKSSFFSPPRTRNPGALLNFIQIIWRIFVGLSECFRERNCCKSVLPSSQVPLLHYSLES